MIRRILLIGMVLVTSLHALHAENGYDLWLRYEKINSPAVLQRYKAAIRQLVFPAGSATLQAASKELRTGLNGLLQIQVPEGIRATNAALLVGTQNSLPLLSSLLPLQQMDALGSEGYLIRNVKVSGKPCLVIAANTDIGILYGVFHFLRLLQTQKSLKQLSITEQPDLAPPAYSLEHYKTLPFRDREK